jgi:protein-tyrosine phosphatase
MTAPKFRVLMVCMGNICRSPTAEGVLRHKLRERGLEALVEVDSAGTHAHIWHQGAPPDERSQAHARRRGYDLSGLRARGVVAADFERFDLVLVMDDDNFDHLQARCPNSHRERLRRLMKYARRYRAAAVPDPYYGGADGFERVLDFIEDACDGLVEQVTAELRRLNAD